jgi:hypothetical protein
MNPDWLVQEEQRLRLMNKLSATPLDGRACAMCAGRDLGKIECHRLQRYQQYEAVLTKLSFKQILEEISKVIAYVSCHSIMNPDRRDKHPGDF